MEDGLLNTKKTAMEDGLLNSKKTAMKPLF